VFLCRCGVSRRNDPNKLPKLIFSIFDDESCHLTLHKPDDPILLGIVRTLVFKIREAEKIAEGSKVNPASLEDPLAFLLVPPNTHG